MLLAIDTNSDAYRAGQMMAPFLLAGIALIALWAGTRNWRRPQPAQVPEDVEEAARLGRARTRQVRIWTAVIVAVAFAMVGVESLRPSDDYGDAAATGSTNLTVTPPAILGDYRLLTGTKAEQLAGRFQGSLPGHMAISFYTLEADPTRPVLFVLNDSGTTDARLAQELAEYSANYENVHFMAGAHIADARVLAPGTAGGQMQCGQNSTVLLCSWADSGTTGALMTPLTSGIGLQQLASLTRDFRPAAEH